MRDLRWNDWTDPLEVLQTEARAFLKQIDFSDFPRGGICINPPELYERKEQLAHAFSKYINEVVLQKIRSPKRCLEVLGDFLHCYIYATDVYRDIFSLVFEYIVENEHMMDLHGKEFAQIEPVLVKDFAEYIETWESMGLKK